MKPLLTGLAVLTVWTLTGCDQETKQPEIPSETLSGALYPAFKPTLGVLPLPNDLLYNGTTDLTLNIPVDDPNDFTNPSVHLSSLDGWSTSAPITINFDDAGSELATPLDESTFIPGQTVRIFETATLVDLFFEQYLGDDDPTNDALVEAVPGSGIPLPTSAPVAVVGELGAEDFIARLSTSDAENKTLEIILNTSLKERTSYVVVLTNGIQSTGGVAIRPDAQYALAKRGPVEGQSATLQGLARLISQIESTVATSATGINTDDIALTIQFTTQSISPFFDNVKNLYFNSMSPLAALAPVAAGGFTPARLGTVCAYVPLFCFNPANPAAPFESARLYRGAMSTPYFLEAWDGTRPDLSNPNDPLNILGPATGFAQAPEAFFVSEPGATPVPYCAENPTLECNFDNPLGRNLTYANTVPKIKSWESIPVLVTLPPDDADKPANGWPVMIFQHGITSNRTAALAMATAMASQGIAIVAIDLPVHGLARYEGGPVTDPNPADPGTWLSGAALEQLYAQDLGADYDPATYSTVAWTPFTAPPANILNGLRERTFFVNILNAQGAPNIAGTIQDYDEEGANPIDSSGAHFVALASPLTTRDNNRQAVVDLMQLFRTIPTMDIDGDSAPDFDPNNISVMGHSLGAIITSTFHANQTGLRATIAANGGGHLARLFEQSPAFGPQVRAGLAGAGILEGTPAYDQFIWLSQTVVDSGDPLSYWRNVGGESPTTTTPLLMFQNENDPVVINSSELFPLSGTETLAAAFGLERPAAPFMDAGGASAFLPYGGFAEIDNAMVPIGSHGAILVPVLSSTFNPAAPSAIDQANIGLTFDMKTAAAAFIASGGAAIQFTPDLLEAEPAE